MNWLFSKPEIVQIQEIENMEIEEDVIQESKKKFSFNSIRGKTIKKTNRFCTKEITIENLIECYTKKIIIIPEFQRILNMEKIDLMLSSYKNDEEYFNYLTNPLQIVRLEDDSTELYFLIDGQHRFFMYKRLYDLTKINGLININIINCSSIDEMYKIYMNFNIDNKDIYFNANEIEIYQINAKYIELRNILNSLYKKYFKINDNLIYSLEGFVKELKNYGYLEYFETIKESISFLIERNDIFIEKYYLIESINIFNKKEKLFILDKKIFSLVNNNFIDFLMCNDEELPTFKFSHRASTKSRKTKYLKSTLI
jgi:hypothetical protein